MNRQESINYLIENPTEELKCTKKIDGQYNNNDGRVRILDGKIVWDDGTSFHVYVRNDKSEFEVVKSEKEILIDEITKLIEPTKYCLGRYEDSGETINIYYVKNKIMWRLLEVLKELKGE